MAVLERHHSPGREALAVAHTLDFIDDRHLGIAGEQEVGMHRVRRSAGHVDSAAGRDQGLANDLAAEYPLPADLRAAAAKDVHLERLEVQDGEQICDRGGHITPPWLGSITTVWMPCFGGG